MPAPATHLTEHFTEHFDVIVVGGGHAGCEAALTAARLGLSTALFTLNLDRIAWQPCNPAVGGPAKSQLVHEVDALGGVIGRLADATALQKRVLNASRGPAVWALRAQTDKRQYARQMLQLLQHIQRQRRRARAEVEHAATGHGANGCISTQGFNGAHARLTMVKRPALSTAGFLRIEVRCSSLGA